MGQSGNGENWSPVNGNAPWWINMLIWILRQGFLFQLATVAILVFIMAVIVGRIDSPMLNAFKRVVDTSQETAVRTHEIVNYMERQTRILEELRDVSRENRNISASIRHNTEPLEQLKDINKK